MSEENTLNEGDQIAATPADFSFFDMLSGVSYPKDEVTVSMNENAAYRARAILIEYDKLEDPTQEQREDFRARLDAIRKEIDDSKVTFFLTGISDEKVTSAKDIVDGRFEDKKKSIIGADGMPRKYIPNEEGIAYARMMNAVITSMHVEKVFYHKNGVTQIGLEPDHMAAFFDSAPTAAQKVLGEAIAKLRVAVEDYESQLDEGFFPKS